MSWPIQTPNKVNMDSWEYAGGWADYKSNRVSVSIAELENHPDYQQAVKDAAYFFNNQGEYHELT